MSNFAFDRLENRWDVSATLVMDTALHIGSGEEPGDIDAGVVRDSSGRPYIPGASLKGVLRSEAERRAWVLGMTACGLYGSGGINCLSSDRSAEKRCREDIKKNGVDMAALAGQICDACRLFGSTVAASRVLFSDLPLQGDYSPTLERRDGVGIDRDTGTAAEHIKYDFQVVPAGTRFTLRLTAENLSDQDRALLALVLLELAGGSLAIGGKKSRGLGRCHLDSLSVNESRFGSVNELLGYLRAKAGVGGSAAPDETASNTFLLDCVQSAVGKAA